MLVLRSIGLAPSVPDDHEKILAMPPPGLKERTKQKLKEILIEEELRKRRVRKMTMIAEGAEAKRQEDEIERRKRKVEDDKKWEGARALCAFCSRVGVSSPHDNRLTRGTSQRLAVFPKRSQEEEGKDQRARLSVYHYYHPSSRVSCSSLLLPSFARP